MHYQMHTEDKEAYLSLMNANAIANTDTSISIFKQYKNIASITASTAITCTINTTMKFTN